MPTSIFAERTALSPSAVIPAGGGTGLAGIGGVLTVSTTQTQTGANTTETDLWTYALPANTLSTNGYGLRITAFGTKAANGNSVSARLYFGATEILLGSTSQSGVGWRLTGHVFRTGASAQLAEGKSLMGSTSITGTVTTPAADTTGAITIKMTGQNGSANAGDIVFRGAFVEFLRAGS